MVKVCVFPFVFVRQPILSTDVLFQKFNSIDELIEFYLNNDTILKALKDANSNVVDEMYRYKKGEITKKKRVRNLFLTMENYFIRMGTRTTPFRLLTQEYMASFDTDKHVHDYLTSNNTYMVGPCAIIDEKNKGRIKLRASSIYVKKLKNIYLERQDNKEKTVIINNSDFLEFVLNSLHDWKKLSNLLCK